MKFCKLLESSLEVEYEKYYVNYRYLKGKIKYSQIYHTEFINLISNELDKVNKFYLSNRGFGLKDFSILNLLAIVKITKKYNKHFNINITKEIYRLLKNNDFYIELFNITDNDVYDSNSSECMICYSNTNYSLTLNCNHSICWGCSLKCYLNNYKKCPMCQTNMELNPLIIKLEQITNRKCNPIYKPIIEKTTQVLMLGIDGLKTDALLYANTPNINKLLNNSSYTFDAHVNSNTISGPSWSSTFSGKPNTVTGIYTNESVEAKDFKWKTPNLFRELNKRGVTTKSIVSSWIGIPNMVQDSEEVIFIDSEEILDNDKQIIDTTFETIKMHNLNSKFIFTYLNSIDDSGHKYGFSIQSPEYISAIEIIDKELSELIEYCIVHNWCIVVTSDHGGTTYSDLSEEQKLDFQATSNVKGQLLKKCKGVHGLDIPQHSRIFQIFYGDKFKKGEITTKSKSTDIYHTILNIMN